MQTASDDYNTPSRKTVTVQLGELINALADIVGVLRDDLEFIETYCEQLTLATDELRERHQSVEDLVEKCYSRYEHLRHFSLIPTA